ncbi:hypothetical protein M4D55_03670 [Metabacillus idriensis]|uniref:Uncharacterized protein n=1 Tax=Metabacillus idriensis TaxID=324768 RepID=A0A6I2M9J2_9BACI|nr:hypothetical protein [Metabacillus idriensis]MCM3594886.1 hypothetical protein [Metabacillus idriensis]MRX53091.1 hypothetical protein [Metabacillus idriensis]
MSKQNTSLLSGVFFILGVIPLIVGLTKWGNGIYVAVLSVSIFLPLILNVLGLIFALFGVKGKMKITLVLANCLGLCLSIFLLYVAMYGFLRS